jgi:RNA recognition motif-containing protein
VSQVKIITDRETGRPRGFAFVELTELKMADSAINDLHGTQFGGRTIVVNKAHQPRHGSGGDAGDAGDAGDRAEADSGSGRGGYSRSRRT